MDGIKTGLLLFFILANSACTFESMLYYPSDEFYSDPTIHYGITPEEIWFQTEENQNRLHGWYFHSPVTRNPKALFVFFHGNAQNITSHYQALMWLLDYEFDFFIFDYQGYGLSEGEPSIRGTSLDGKAALKIAHWLSPNLPLVVFGQSLGGIIAAKAAEDLIDQIPLSLVFIDSSFDSYLEIAQFKAKQMGLSWIPDSALPSDEYSPQQDLCKLSPTPIVVMHGDQDSVVDFSFGQKFVEHACEPKEFWKVPGGGHIDGFSKHGNLFRPKLLEKVYQILHNS